MNVANPSASRVGEIVVDVSQLKSDESARDNAIRRKWLESKKYPLARLRNVTLSDVPKSIAEGKPFSFKMVGDFTLHATTRKLPWDVTATLDGDTLRGEATTRFKMSQFNVDPPNIANFVKAEDEAKITLQFVANAVKRQ